MKKSDILDLYTLKLQRINNPNPKREGTIFIKHCLYSKAAGCYLRPVKYKNINGDRKPVNNIDEEIGWEWEPVEETDYKIVAATKEKSS